MILVPIAVVIDLSQKIDKFLKNTELTFHDVLFGFYQHFIIYYVNTFMPLALFIAVLLFTSRLADNTEIIALHNAKISFTRFLKPYFIGASIVAITALYMNHYVVPNSTKKWDDFDVTYLNNRKLKVDYVKNISLQLDANNYIFIRSFSAKSNRGYDFSYEKYDGLQLKYRLTADNITWQKKDSTYRLINYHKRTLLKNDDNIKNGRKLDTIFPFSPKDLVYVGHLAKYMKSPELNTFIKRSKKRGVKNVNAYLVELYKRTSLPISSFILTLIAVTLASKKRRGGMGVNLAIGIGLMFFYVFFMKVFEILAAVAGANALLMVWIPNIIFGILAIYLYSNARK